MKTNYEDLEGKKFVYEMFGGDGIKCVVAGAEYGVGLTVARADNKKVLMVCLVRSEYGKGNLRGAASVYRRKFQECIKLIKNQDVINESEFALAILGRIDNFGSGCVVNVDRCAFSA